ncbi:4-(cytidine 5'-diphospho)-2-C-methyl-D-erythritol kinase [Amylibacter sp. SFDW26]|uniref:4-(cytidine 5'-diphospho)-2-C-methyl-D-erythritol kinase n=1 Tax=Amylibacter sp. SFDW26 TaxID=2652722 RepID=UPI001261A2E2|nr:4-(cytidine 5'-diphospho)-2-C-methyl-D-erythritol kinase [Amylibacter sp. SFDW26]KAB7614772.1 4-(cytidine 5'-diphospho)-2-C-methyl-D-erythritol kinase [Amylibacter sp. SFDW26]
MRINELARAKINLCLHVTGQRDDGYHLLDSLVVFADTGDDISIKASVGFSLEIDGPFAEGLSAGYDNLVLKAAKLFEPHCEGAAITLTKNLPVASGIGGGSADAAATLRAMAKMTGAELPKDAGLSLGADVPVCLAEQSCRMQGIGDQITPIQNVPQMAAVLVRPNIAVSTPVIFKAISNKNNTGIMDYDHTDIIKYLKKQRNDLELPARAFAPEIGMCLQALKDLGALLARMSGSGATCFGIFETKKDATDASNKLAKAHPDWWVKACCLGD